MDQSQVTIIIPALNEANAIGSIVTQLRKLLPDTEIIVVNDGSKDDTGTLAAKSGATVITHERPFGYGASLRDGVEASKRDYVLCCDGDGQHRVEDVLKLIEAADGYDMVVGQRNCDSHRPLSRRPGKFVLTLFSNYLAGKKIPDLNSGLRIIKREVLLRYIHLMPRGFSFSTTSTFAMMKTDRKIKYIPIKVEKRIGLSTVRPLKHGLEAIMLMLRLTVLFEPLKVFLHVTYCLFILSTISLCIDFYIGISFGLSDTTVLLLIATLIVFMFGLLCDQVSAMRRELHEKDH